MNGKVAVFAFAGWMASLLGSAFALDPTPLEDRAQLDEEGREKPAWHGDLTNSGTSGLGPWRATRAIRGRDSFDMGATTMAPDGSGVPFFFRGSSLVAVDNVIGGPDATGAKYTVLVRSLFDEATSPRNLNRNYVGHASQMIVRAPDAKGAGTVATRTGTYSGAFFAYHPYCVAEPGATNIMDLACTEADVGIMPGASARIRRAFVANAFQSGQGRELDAAYTVASSDPKTHWRDGYVLTDINGHPAVDPNGTLFAIRNYGGPLTAAWGFDLQQANLTEGILRTPSVTLGNGYLSIERPNAGLELGSLTEPGLAYVDFHTSGKPSDYDARIIASEGAGKPGGGTLTLQAHQVKVAGAAVFSHAPPSEPSSPCREGTVTWSRSHIYICVGTDRWRRAALSDW